MCYVYIGTSYYAYWVIETDYSKYALVFSCLQMTPMMTEQYGWILSRTPELDSKTVDQLKSRFSKAGINPKYFQKTDQVNCPPTV